MHNPLAIIFAMEQEAAARAKRRLACEGWGCHGCGYSGDHIARGEVWWDGRWVFPMVFGLTHSFTYLGGFEISRDVREYARGCYEMACPVCGAARQYSIRNYEPDATLYSCFKCRVLWGDASLITDFSVPSPEEIQKYRLSNPWL